MYPPSYDTHVSSYTQCLSPSTASPSSLSFAFSSTTATKSIKSSRTAHLGGSWWWVTHAHTASVWGKLSLRVSCLQSRAVMSFLEPMEAVDPLPSLPPSPPNTFPRISFFWSATLSPGRGTLTKRSIPRAFLLSLLVSKRESACACACMFFRERACRFFLIYYNNNSRNRLCHFCLYVRARSRLQNNFENSIQTHTRTTIHTHFESVLTLSAHMCMCVCVWVCKPFRDGIHTHTHTHIRI